MKYLLIFMCAALFLSSCGTKEATTVQLPALTGSFKVIKVAGTDLGMIRPTINTSANETKISGYAGCSTYAASYTMTDTSFTIQNLERAQVDCFQGMAQEDAFMKAMSKVNNHSLKNGKLTLYQDQTVLIEAQSNDM